MGRKKIVAGNWKMNLKLEEGVQFAKKLVEGYIGSDPEMVLIPPFTHLIAVKEIFGPGSLVALGAQNCHQEVKGAYTGEVSASMLSSIGVHYIIIGHSERRTYFNETDALLSLKVNAVLAQGLSPIFCVGESLEIRNQSLEKDFVQNQLDQGLFHLTADQIVSVVIAYEPIWAIGTGVTASPAQAQEMHAFIRNAISKKYGLAIANKISILYGGSVKASNAREIFCQSDVDGGLVGGASLDVSEFLSILASF